MQLHIELITKLYHTTFGVLPKEIHKLPQSGSDRIYYRIIGERKCVATVNQHIRENQTFLQFTRHFKESNVPVPEIFAVSEDERIYLQEDFGDVSLLNE